MDSVARYCCQVVSCNDRSQHLAPNVSWKPLLSGRFTSNSSHKACQPRSRTQFAIACSMTYRRVAWRITKVGDISNLKLVEDTVNAPLAGEIRVAVKAVGLNFADVFTCLGLYAASPRADFVPGLEFSGVVEESGPPGGEGGKGTPMSHFKKGDRVMGVTRFGAFSSQVVVPAHQLKPLPEGWSFNEGAAFLVQGLTAIYGLKGLGDIKAGHCVLIQSAAGGVGLAALAICEALGATPVPIVGSKHKVDVVLQRCRSVARDHVIIRGKGAAEFAQQLATVLQTLRVDGFDIALDAVAGHYFNPTYERLSRGGRYIVYGAADLTPTGDRVGWLKLAWQWLRRPRVDPITMVGENKAVMGFNLIYMFDKVDMLDELSVTLSSLDLPPPLVGEVFPFAAAPDAIRRFQSGATVGKVVLEI